MRPILAICSVVTRRSCTECNMESEISFASVGRAFLALRQLACSTPALSPLNVRLDTEEHSRISRFRKNNFIPFAV